MPNKLKEQEALLSAEPLLHLAEPTSLHSRPSPEAFTALLQLMPTRRQATAAIDVFFARVDPLVHVVHRPRFEAQCELFWKSGSTDDPHWLATFLSVTGNGLLAMEDGEEAAAHSMPSGDGKGLLARSWLDGALQALCSGGTLISCDVLLVFRGLTRLLSLQTLLRLRPSKRFAPSFFSTSSGRHGKVENI